MEWNKPKVVAIVVNGQPKLVYDTRDIRRLNRDMFQVKNAIYRGHGLNFMVEDGGKYAHFIDIVEFDTFMKAQDDGFKFCVKRAVRRHHDDLDGRLDTLENRILKLTNDLGTITNKLAGIECTLDRICYKLGLNSLDNK